MASNWQKAFEEVWVENGIVAITPFVLSYSESPFALFSWKKPTTQEFYPQYEMVQNMQKVKGAPEQIKDSKFLANSIPDELVINSFYELPIRVLNKGQSIWNEEESYTLGIQGDFSSDQVLVSNLAKTLPNQETDIYIALKTPKEKGDKEIIVQMQKETVAFGESFRKKISLIPPPHLTFKAKLFAGKEDSKNDIQIAFYENGIFRKEYQNLIMKEGVGEIAEIYDVVPNKYYSLIIRKPYFLPKKKDIFLSEETTSVDFETLLPFDFNNDADFDFWDFPAAFESVFSGGKTEGG